MASAKPFDFEFSKPEYVANPLGKDRVLVICLPEPVTIESRLADPLYVSIDWQGFEERDLVIVEIRKSSAHVLKEHDREGAVARYLTSFSERYRDGSRKKGLKEIAQCENKLEYILIGKDQTPKRRWDLFPSNDELYTLIDDMPMRRIEMRQRRRDG